MKIYNYDRVNGVFLFEDEARQDPLTPGMFLIPAYATEIPPPTASGHDVPVFNGSAWSLQPNFIGAEVYSTETGNRIYITALGPLPDNTTLLVPPATYPKWDGEKWIDDVEQAAADVIRALEDFCDLKQQENFFWHGHYYYADKGAQEDFSKTLQRTSRLADSVPVPTPAPITGKWKTADLDEDGINIFADMTVGELRDFSDALYDHIAGLWAIKDGHKIAIRQMILAGKTSAQIANYDFTIGW